MNSDSRYVETEIDLKEVLIRLLSQWKAVLIASLIVMVMATGLKHSKDVANFNAANEAEPESVTTAEADARIAEIYEELGEDCGLVDLVMREEKWLDEGYDYINNSLIMQMDSSNVRDMDFFYSFSGARLDDSESAEAAVIYQYYSSYLMSDEFLAGLSDALGLDKATELRYVKELVRTGNQTSAFSSSSSSLSLAVMIRLPDGADAESVKSYVVDAMNKKRGEISRDVSHELKLIAAEETCNNDQDIYNRKTNLISNLYNIQNALKNNKNALSDAQKSAYNEIKSLSSRIDAGAEDPGISVDVVDGDDSPEGDGVTVPAKPGYSKKYALLGFVLGAMLYAFVYVIYLIMKNKVRSVSDAENYTGARVLGEIYTRGEHSGISKLFHSGVVENALYKGLRETDKQLARSASSIAAICENKGIKDISLISVGDDLPDDSAVGQILGDLQKQLKSKKITSKLVSIDNDIDESTLVDLQNAVLVVSADKTASTSLIKTANLCREFGVECLGTLYSRVI